MEVKRDPLGPSVDPADLRVRNLNAHQLLRGAELEGAKILDSLASQAKSLREHAFQMQRAEVKKLPVSMVVMFGMHLLPFLFVVALYPTLVSLSGL